jgi:hypothetical protein
MKRPSMGRRFAALLATTALVFVGGAAAYASTVDVTSVVDVTAPITSVELAPGGSGTITINMQVTGNQAGTATFKVYRDWNLSGGVFTGSNPQTFTVDPQGGGTTTPFSTTGTVTVAAGQAAGTTHTLTVGAFDITNSNETGAKLAAGASSSYTVTVSAPSDTTPPVISYTLDPTTPDGEDGWYIGDVFLNWTVNDPDSPISSSSGCDDLTISADQDATTYTCTATSAGGTNSDTTVAIKRDATKPDITWNGGPEAGGSYYFGSVPTAPTCGATDDLSGPDGCTVSGYSNATGEQTMTATAYDKAGNKKVEERTYTVLAWTLNGFYRPVDMTPLGGDTVWNTVKGGSTVPLKFEVFSGDTELTDVSAVKSFSAKSVPCAGSSGVEAEVEFTTTGGTSLRYDSTGGQFIQNWQTLKKPGTCYVVTMTTQDGSTLVANFKLK